MADIHPDMMKNMMEYTNLNTLMEAEAIYTKAMEFARRLNQTQNRKKGDIPIAAVSLHLACNSLGRPAPRDRLELRSTLNKKYQSLLVSAKQSLKIPTVTMGVLCGQAHCEPASAFHASAILKKFQKAPSGGVDVKRGVYLSAALYLVVQKEEGKKLSKKRLAEDSDAIIKEIDKTIVLLRPFVEEYFKSGAPKVPVKKSQPKTSQLPNPKTETTQKKAEPKKQSNKNTKAVATDVNLVERLVKNSRNVRKDRETAKKFADSQINKEIDEALAAPSTEYVYPAEVDPIFIHFYECKQNGEDPYKWISNMKLKW